MSDGKIRPLPGAMIHVADGYRGDSTIGWTLVPSKRPGGRGTEMYGTWCVHCLTSWGWAVTASQAARLHKAMKKHGCPRCEKAKAEAAARASAPLPSPERTAERRVAEYWRKRLRSG